MALDIKQTEEAIKALQEELILLEDSLTSIASKISATVKDQMGSLDAATKKTAQRYSQDFTRATEKVKNNFREQAEIRKRIITGETLSVSTLEKLAKLEKETNKQKEIAIRSANNLKRNGLYIDEEELIKLEEQAEAVGEGFEQTKNLNKQQQDNLGILDLAKNAATTFANNIDKSGALAKVLSGELSLTQKYTLAAQAGFAVFVASMLKGSSLISNIRKETGLSSEAARNLQLELATSSLNSEKLFITSERLNKSFLELTRQTGLIADFGGDILITQTTLTKQLNLSAESAGKLSILSRIQSKNTEGVLDNTVAAVSALSQQEKVGINVRGILEEIGSVSDSIAVSLGKSPIEIAKAITQSKLLGLSLSEVDSIASSILNFESSILAEMEAEMLLGKDLNLEKARQLALDNDLAGLAEELRNQEELRLAFTTGNRIQQEAAASAIGISRDQLAKITLQQDLNNMAAEQFVATYGEATYQSLQAQSASEKFGDMLERVKGVLVDIGTIFTPILEGFANFVSLIAESKIGLTALAGVAGTLMAISVAKAIADSIAAFTILGPIGVGLGIAASAGIITAVGAGLALADDMVMPSGYGDRILSTPKGSIALNNQDTVVAGTNLGGGGGNLESKRTNQLLEMILSKQGTVRMDSTNVGTAFSVNTYQIQ